MPGSFVPLRGSTGRESDRLHSGRLLRSDRLRVRRRAGQPFVRNYPAYSGSTLGQQELQIYPGGGGAGANATGLAGFINQVVQTGTFPGSPNVSGGVGEPTFYHDVSLEVAGATPSRLFSDTSASAAEPGVPLFRPKQRRRSHEPSRMHRPINLTTSLDFYPAVYPTCNATRPKNPCSFLQL